METSSSSKDLRSFLDGIKISDVVENRTQLLLDLGELEITDKSEVACLIGELTNFWEDSICLDISQCTMNKAILQIAAKYLDTDISGASGEFLGLGMKASVWCGKHLKMTLMSTGESQEEEHSNLFYQVLRTLLSYSASIFSVSTSSSASIRSELFSRIENFLSEVLSLTKDTLSAIKSMDTVGSEVQKVAQTVLEAVIQLCKAYCQGINWGSKSSRREEEMQVTVTDMSMDTDHAIKITKVTINKLCEVGFLAANDGGTLVGVLNVSWKGVVALLQLGKGALAANLDVVGVILTLISLANQALKCAAETWSLKLEEAVQLTEAKRIFLPVKFYLINAVRIISQYPAQAFSAHKEILRCVMLISSFKLYLSMGENLKFASEALGEILEPTSFHLLNAILNSVHAKQEEKLQVLEWLFGDEIDMDAVLLKFNVKGADPTSSLGQVYLFLYLLRSSSGFEDHMKAWMAQKLPWLLDILINEEVYNITLCLQIHVTCTSSQDQKPVYKPFLRYILDALKTFMVVMSSSNSEWVVIEYFLLQNLIHPHFLCREIVNDLWCFILRHAETDLVSDIIDKLCLLLISVASAESVASPVSALRQIARSICLIVSCGSQAVADQVYNFATGDGKHQNSNSYTAMLIEGFPLNLLPERTRSAAKQKIVSEYFCYIENFISEPPRSGGFESYGAPVFALSATLQFKQVSLSDTEMKTLKFLVAVIEKYKNAKDCKMKGIYGRLLGEGLGIVSHIKNLYSSDDMEGVILELQNLFISKSSSSASDGFLYLCKPNLANFMSSLGHLEFAEEDDNLKCAAIWGLFHMLLREKHWAFAHLAMSAFGYFASHTSCSQLWRFVPDNAALSYDLDSGNEADEERFMSELKGFLDKHSSSLLTKPTPDHMAKLLAEGLKLKEKTTLKSRNIKEEVVTCDAMEIDEEIKGTRKRKLPDGISRGVELLQSGLKVMGHELSKWQHNHIDQTEIQDKFISHFSRLEDVVSNLANLAGDS